MSGLKPSRYSNTESKTIDIILLPPGVPKTALLDLLSEIVPKDYMLKIEASVLPIDIAYVRKGQKAKIAFTAYDMAIYGQFEGVVTKIASNTTSTQDGTTYYPAIIEIDYNQVNDSDRKIILQSGMQSDVSIIGEERTVLSYVLNPITKLSQRALQE